jgi:hypothetical protein
VRGRPRRREEHAWQLPPQNVLPSLFETSEVEILLPFSLFFAFFFFVKLVTALYFNYGSLGLEGSGLGGVGTGVDKGTSQIAEDGLG